MAHKALKAFETFLGNLDLRDYEKKYRPIKTVEQDLPKELNPLPDLYKHYWKPDEPTPSFPKYEDFFAQWWDQRLKALDTFIRKYFWGCSYQFVRLGFTERLYRYGLNSTSVIAGWLLAGLLWKPLRSST